MTSLKEIATAIKSNDNELHELNGAVLFSSRPQTKGKPAHKGPLQCALEMADLLGHEIVLSYANTKKDFWYGSYKTREEAIELALNMPDSKYFEIIRPHNARYMIADMEYVNGFILGPDEEKGKINPKIVTKVLIDFICDLAEELSGVKVSRKVEIGSSRGQAADKNWSKVDKVSKHIKFDFGFVNQMHNRDFATAVTNRILQGNVPYLRYYDKSEKKAKSIFDDHPYSKNQAWRCLNSKKAQDSDPRRRLRADPGSSTKIADHFAVILDAKHPGIQILEMDIASTKHKPKRVVTEVVNKEGGRSLNQTQNPTAVLMKVPLELLAKVIENYSADRSDTYGSWRKVLWGTFNVCNENDYLEEGRALMKQFSSRSSKYDEREIDVLWNTTQYRQDGLHWPSLRGWLWEDNRPVWRELRRNPEYSSIMTKDKKHIYRELYTPHPERFKDVIKHVLTYKARHLLPYELEKYDVHVDNSPMDTRKTARIVDLVVSGQYESIVIYVNRSTLCRAYISRLNIAIREAMGVYDESRMFRDYRRPKDVRNPLAEENDTDTEIYTSDSSDSESTWQHKCPFSGNTSDSGSDSDSDADEADKPVTEIDLTQHPFLVMQMESGHKLVGDAPDLLVVDECESDLAQFSSPTMKKLKKCSLIFYDYIRTAGKVIFTDAFVSDKTLSFVHSAFFGTKARVIYRHNTWIPENRKAYEIQAKDSKSLKSSMMAAIAAKVKARQKVVLFSSNNKFATAVADKLRQMFPDRTVLLYNKYTDDSVKDAHFDNVDVIWNTADVVIYSPILLAGVSFNVLDYFNCLFIFGYNMSCCVRDMWQASGRVRKFKDQELFYALDTFGKRPWNLPVTYDSVRSAIYKHGELNKKYIAGTEMDDDFCPGEYIDPTGDLLMTLEDDKFDAKDPANFETIIEKAQKVSIIRKMEKAPAWLLDVHVRNIWEKYLTNNPASYKTVFQDFMKLAGWHREGILSKSDITRWENTIRRETGEKPKRVVETEMVRDYGRIDQITSEEAYDITGRRNRGMASNVEKLKLERYWFDTEVAKNWQCPFETKARVFGYLDDRVKRKHLLNIWAEATQDARRLAEHTTDINPYPELMDSTLPSMLGVSEMLSLLGLQSTHDVDTLITEEVLQTNIEKFHDIIYALQEDLDITPTSSKSDKPLKVLKLNMDTILQDFAGTKLVGTRRRARAEGMASHYDYRLKKAEGYIQDIIDVVCFVVEVE